MTDELRQKVERLRALAPKLNAATEEAGRIVQAVETLLSEELSLGVSAMSSWFDRVALDTDEDGTERQLVSYLTYCRYAGQYRICVNHVTEVAGGRYVGDFDFHSEEYVPWSSCPREVKLGSYAKLPELLDSIAEETAKLTDKAEETTATVRGLIDLPSSDASEPAAAPAAPKGRKAK
jgi:hypothetical protein